MNQEYFKEQCLAAYEIIKNSNNILLSGHISPDGDSLGSVLAFANALYENENKTSISYSKDPVPKMLQFLHNSSKITNKIDSKIDCLIAFDYGSFERLGIYESLLKDVKIITFDHHPYRGQKGDVCIIDETLSSTTELLYYFMREIEWSIDEKTAECLLTGIVTDTGNFEYNTKPGTFNVAGELSKRGASVSTINQKIKSSISQEIINMHGQLLEMAEMDEKYNCIRLFIPFEKFNKLNIHINDLSGITGNLKKIDSVNFSLFVVEHKPSVIKGSLRGEETIGIPVAPIAEQLGGGGHKYAAGFSLEMSYEEAKNKIYEAIQQNITL